MYGKRKAAVSKSKGGAVTVRNPLYKAVKRIVSRTPRGELKFFDTAISFTADATGEVPATGQLCLIPEGPGENERIGRKCIVKSIQFRGFCQFAPAAAATAATQAFIFVVYDRQCNGAAAAITDVLTTSNMATGLLNLSNSKRFRILRKEAVTLMPSAGATTAYNNVVAPIDFWQSVNLPLDYGTGAGGAISDQKSGNIFLLAGTDGQSDDTVTVAGQFRLRFSDQ